MAGKDLRVRVDDAGARYPVTIDPVVQAAKLVAQTMLYGSPYNDGVAGDQLGRSIAISDDGSTVVVGAPFKRLNNIRSGVAYVFVRPSEQEGGWNSPAPMHYANRLQASDFATSGLTFGMSVAVSGDGGVIVVGATGVNQAIYQGAAYVYVRMIGYWGGGWALAQTAKLTPFNNTGSSNFGGFGTSVSIADNGATIVVGSPNRSDLNGSYPDGAVHAFFRPAIGWVDMTQSATVSGLAATGLINTRFGSSVSLSGDRWFLVVGSPAEWDYRGAAYLFMLSSSGGTLHYAKVARFFKNDGGPYEVFGNAVAINTNGSNFAVSAPGAPIEGRTQGAILVYERPTTQLDWILKARLTMANGVEDDALGSSLSMSGDGNTIVAGSPHYPGTSAGAAYVFVKPVGGWINSTENAKRQADDIVAGDNFGHAAAVSADGTTWAVAAPFATIGSNARQGSAYVLTGLADNPVAAVSPSSLMFGPSDDGQNPGPQTVTLTNAGAGPLIVTGVSVTGQFTSTQNCLAASPLGPGSSCSEQVAFAPLSTELTTGALTFTDNSTGVAGSTQTVGLQGYGIKVNTSTAITAVSANPALAGQPVSVSFAVTAQSGAMATPSGVVTVQASTGETCTASAPSGSCALTFSTAVDRTLTASYSGDTTFKPSTSPAGSLKVVDFGLSVSPASQTVQGRKATYIVTVSGVNGFAGTVALSCSGGPANTTCAMSPQSLTLPSATTTSKAAVTLPAGARGGSYVITVSGSFGGVMRTATATLVKPATLAK
jgi:trimeric autotransporter adhesin